MILTRTITYSPSSDLSELSVGDLFKAGGKMYILLERNPWTAKITRFTHLDLFVEIMMTRYFEWKHRRNKK